MRHTLVYPPTWAKRAFSTTKEARRRQGSPTRPGCLAHECARAEHYKLLLGNADDMELLAEAANLLARVEIPRDVAEGIALTRMTAIRKPGGGVRGIATGDMFRRLVSRPQKEEPACLEL